MDVNVERAEDVLTHQRLLKLAEDPATRPVFEVRCVQVIEKHLSFLSLSLIFFWILNSLAYLIGLCWSLLQVSPSLNGHSADIDASDPAVKEDAQSSYHSSRQGSSSV